MPRDTSGSIPLKETNNHPQGKSGSRAKEFTGPAAGGNAMGGNPTKGGGINRPTKGGSSTGA